MNKFSLEKKNIVITGASSGIGRQCAIECSKAGANVVLIGRNSERLNSALKELEKGNHIVYSFDITKFDEIKDIVNDTVTKLGKIDGFIHSAGVELTKPFNLTKPEDYEMIFKVNVISGFEFAKIVSSKKYINNNGGSFVFVSSVMGKFGVNGKLAYCASKGAIDTGVKSMALELAPKRIRVNCVSPAVVETELSKAFIEKLSTEALEEMIKMHPLGLGLPVDVANICIFLLSDETRWVTGSDIVVDGGYCAK